MTANTEVMLSCGHPPTPSGFGTGYATLPDGTRICYRCAEDRERADMISADRIVAYLAADGGTATTWTGGLLGTVTSLHDRPAAMKTYVWIRDVFSGVWHGVGPRESGTYVSLRRSRRGPAALPAVPDDFPVKVLSLVNVDAGDLVTCGTCRRSWDDNVSTEWTPAPSGRCPFEYFH